jgi:tellurite resistance protein
MYELRLDRKQTKEIVSDQPKEIRDWVVNAIGNMVVVDGIVEEHELIALHEAINLLDTKEEAQNLMTLIKQKKLYDIEPLKVPMEVGAQLFFYIAAISIIDGNLKKVEADLLLSIARKLGLSADFGKVVMRWAQRQMEANRKWGEEQNRINLERLQILETTRLSGG